MITSQIEITAMIIVYLMATLSIDQSRVFEFSTDYHYYLTLKMASAQVVETSVTNSNSAFQDSNHPDDLFQSRYVTPGFNPFS